MLWRIEIEPEVRQWLELLTQRHYDKAERAADMLASQPTTLGEPYSRHLGGKVRELRFTLDGDSVRITYWLAPRQRIVLLTVFRKTRPREETEIERARQAQKVCEAEHDPAEHTYDRDKEETP
ncbi:MAG: type II toxin-antitoxin system RelE/ParE family toxin [Spirillospora sp.]